MPLRPPHISDASSIAAISIEVWISTYLKRGVNGFFADYALSTFTTEKTAQLIADPAQFILVSENQDGLDGFIRLTADSPAPIPPSIPASAKGAYNTEIATLYVQPRHHNTGIGRNLLRAALAHCRAKGMASVWLTTNAENAPAIAFYLAQGFTQIGETHFRIGDAAYLNNVYALHLT